MDEQEPHSKKLLWAGRIAVFAVTLIIAVAVITQSNFLEGLLKLIGAGAAEVSVDVGNSELDVPIQLADVEIKYNYLTAPEIGNVRINSSTDGYLVVEQADSNLTLYDDGILFEDVELNQGEQYVLVMEGEGVTSLVLYFVATERDDDRYSFQFGSFKKDVSSSLQGDFNGDGQVDSVDFAIFLEQFKGNN